MAIASAAERVLSADVARIAKELGDRDRFTPFFGLLEALSSASDLVLHLVNSPNDRGNVIAKMRKAAAISSPFAVFTSIGGYLSKLESALASNQRDVLNLSPIHSAVIDFREKYDLYISNQADDRLFSLVWAGKALHLSLHGASAAWQGVGGALAPYGDDSEDVLTVRLEGTLSATQINAAIRALERMYVLIGQLLVDHVPEQPFELIKIETGSLFLQARGDRKIIAILRSFLVEFVPHVLVSRHMSTAQIDLSMLESQAALSRSLAQQGCDLGAYASKLPESSDSLARNTKKLLGTAEDVGINGELLSTPRQLTRLTAPSKRLGWDQGEATDAD